MTNVAIHLRYAQSMRLISLTLLLLAALWLVPHYAHAWLPAIHAIVQQLLPDFSIRHAEVLRQNDEWTFGFVLATRTTITIDQQAMPVGTTISTSTLAAHAIKTPIILVAAIVLWPLPRLRAQAKRVLLSIPAAGALTLLDIPFMLAGAVTILFDERSLFSLWMQWLDGGGRFALAIVLAALIRECSRQCSAN